jgi:hypothetical protein
MEIAEKLFKLYINSRTNPKYFQEFQKEYFNPIYENEENFIFHSTNFDIVSCNTFFIKNKDYNETELSYRVKKIFKENKISYSYLNFNNQEADLYKNLFEKTKKLSVMHLNLKNENSFENFNINNNLQVSTVDLQNEKIQMGISTIMCTVYSNSKEESLIKTNIEMYKNMIKNKDFEYHVLLGEYEDKYVTCGSLIISENSSMIFEMATVKEYRYHHFATTILYHLCKDSKYKYGCSDIYLLSGFEDGHPLYLKNGFKTLSQCDYYMSVQEE